MQRKAAAGNKPKWVPKGTEEDDAGMSPILSMKSEGPCFDKLMLLKVYQAAMAHKEEQDDGEKIDVGLTERPATEGESKKEPGTRRALREAKKAQKRLNEEHDEGYNYVEDFLNVQEYGGDAHPAAAEGVAHQVAMMQWLQSMAFASPMACGIPPGPQGYTTVMLRNIPNRYTRDMLIERLNEMHKGQFDFVYLPIDFNSKCNVGYAFINFRNPSAASVFTAEFHGKRTNNVLPGFSSAKVCQVTYARVQGREANMENLRDEKFIEKLTERPEWQPLFYDEDGKEVDFCQSAAGPPKKKKPQQPQQGMYNYPPMMYPPMMYPPFTPMAPATGTSTSLSTVLPSATPETMLMLKEVPTSLTQDSMIELLDKSLKGSYDFIYLPKDTKGEGNRGFAFVNFKIKEKAEQFTKQYNGVKVSEAFPGEAESDKTCEVANARLHSLEGLIARAQAPKQKAEGWGPLLFSPDGERLQFPAPAEKGGKGQSKSTATTGAAEDAGSPAEEGSEEDKKEGKKKGKGEGKGKGKAAKTPSASMGYQQGQYGFGPPGYNAASYMAQSMMAMQQIMAAHTSAHAAAAKYAAPKADKKPPPSKPLTEDTKGDLKKQIEFYFSGENLCKDVFLRQHMDSTTGYTPLDLITSFPKVKKFRAKTSDVERLLGDSATLELDETKKLIRLKDEAERKRWATPDATAEEK